MIDTKNTAQESIAEVIEAAKKSYEERPQWMRDASYFAAPIIKRKRNDN
jgi:hypothetical protein